MSTEAATPEVPVVPPNPHPASVQPAPVAAQPSPAAPAAPPTLVAAATLSPPAAPTAVAVPMEEFLKMQAAQGRLVEIETERQRIARDAEEARAAHLAKEGKWEQGFEKLKGEHQSQLAKAQQDLAIADSRAKKYALDRELAMALTGYDFTSQAAARQFTDLVGKELIAEPQGDSFVVRTPTFQSAAELLAAKRQHPDYLHFFKASTQGGTAGGPTSAAVAPPEPKAPEPAVQPRNMGEAVILHMQSIQKASGDARSSMSMPMGLKAVR